jgi:hypothetical protein
VDVRGGPPGVPWRRRNHSPGEWPVQATKIGKLDTAMAAQRALQFEQVVAQVQFLIEKVSYLP